MSTIPKGFQDNYSKHNKKIDNKGNLKPHPRAVKKPSPKLKPAKPGKKMKSAMEKMLEYEASLPDTPSTPPVSAKPKVTKTEKAAGAVGEALGKAKKYLVGETYDKAHADYLKRRKQRGR